MADKRLYEILYQRFVNWRVKLRVSASNIMKATVILFLTISKLNRSTEFKEIRHGESRRFAVKHRLMFFSKSTPDGPKPLFRNLYKIFYRHVNLPTGEAAQNSY